GRLRPFPVQGAGVRRRDTHRDPTEPDTCSVVALNSQDKGGSEMKTMTMPSETWAFVSRRSGLARMEINTALEEAFEQLTEKIARARIRTRGLPRAHFRYRDGADEVGF